MILISPATLSPVCKISLFYFFVEMNVFLTTMTIKTLIGIYKNESQIDDRLRDIFIRFQEELSKKGISVEIRFVTTKVGYDKVPHDRSIYNCRKC